ncbi:Sulfurtransferase TusA [Aquimixticola soesokkakensis]|uniref:Sulfurtransferase TusA n=1 Tax=Aquimixticola soesokkakensis TaxID=1519096 RepID=A0A1Y5STN9_9RHOB|nr:sulfurtransferase TusA family protein [Aquimixticola soesokkakensis]SLN46691.1 Sulfurtransferase TusA [Aquimixticola soesokkakensis]
MDTVIDIDALGLLCPLPVLRLRKVLAGLPVGAQVRLLADDPVAVLDVPHYCTQAGHRFDGMQDRGGSVARPERAYLVTKTAP